MTYRYYPYLRGRQEELLALKNLLNDDLLSPLILPVIEPVKASSTLLSTLNVFREKDRKVVVVLNPEYGDFDSTDDTQVKELERFVDDNSSVIPAVIFNEHWERYRTCIEAIQNMDDLLCIMRENRYERDGDGKVIDLAKLNPTRLLYQDTAVVKKDFNDTLVQGTNTRATETIRLHDSFPSKPRNADYIDSEPPAYKDELFSTEHLKYMDRGDSGFADFSIVGSGYRKGGWAAHAVAIHMVYFGDDKQLMVRHYVSKSSSDYHEGGTKFLQAVSLMMKDMNSGLLESSAALDMFQDYYEGQSFPGLGVAKRLSIMHHLELMGRYLDGQAATRK